MTDYKILFLDVDGTILTPEGTIQASTKDAIAQVQAKGVEVFLATGRPLHEIDDLAKELNIHSFVGYNGAYAKYQGKDIYQEPIDQTIVKQFMKIVSHHHHEAVLYTNGKNVFTNIDAPDLQQFMEIFHLHKNVSYSESFNEDVLGITLVNLTGKDVALYEKEESIHLSQVNVESMLHCYDVIRDKVNKGYGLEMVLRHLGIPRDRSIAFGDGMNDKEMLQMAGEGVAMGNGHPDLFQFAKHKTTEVTNSGVYNGLKMLHLVE